MSIVERNIYRSGGLLTREKTVPVRRMTPVYVGDSTYQIRPVEIMVSPQMAALYKNHPDTLREVDLSEAVYAGDVDPELQLSWFRRKFDENGIGADMDVQMQIDDEELVLCMFSDDLVEGGSEGIVEMVVVKRESDDAYAGICLRGNGSVDVIVGAPSGQDVSDFDPHVWLRSGWDVLKTLD